MIYKLTHSNKWLTLCAMVIFGSLAAVGLSTIKPGQAHAYPALDQNAINWANACENGTAGTAGQISGVAYFVSNDPANPGSVTLTVGQTSVNITLRTLVCNGSDEAMTSDIHYYSNSSIVETGATNVIGYNDPVNPWGNVTIPNSPPSVYAGNWNTVDSGALPNCNGIPATNTCYSVTDRTVSLDVSSIKTSGTYTILIHGFGNIRLASTTNCSTAFNGGLPDGLCGVTNVADSPFFLNVIVQPPSGSAVAGGAGGCGQISGYAFDPDNTDAKLKVQMTVDGADTYTATANQVMPLVAAGNGSESNQPGHGYVFNQVSQYSDAYQHTYSIRVFGVDSAGVPDGHDQVLSPVTIGPCVHPTCTVVTSVTPVVVGSNFTVTATLSYGPIGVKGNKITDPPTTANVSVTGPGGFNANYNPLFGSLPPPGSVQATTGPVNVSTVGNYNISVKFDGGGADPAVCSGTFIATLPATAPYLGVYGGDVFAGGGFGAGCSPVSPANSKITTSRDSVSNLGAGSQLAAFALDTITGFNSAELRTAQPNPPDGLSFANDGSPGTPGTFGGNNCVITAPPSGTPVADPISGWSGINHNTSSLTTAGGTIEPGQNITVYVTGDLTITGNITYDTGTPWTSAANVPSITFIVQGGNIYIGQGVTELDGTYITEPDAVTGTGGTIDTCYDNVTPARYTSSDLSLPSYQTNCSKQLVVYGSLVAKHINWLRTFSDVAKATAGENPYSGPNPNCPSPDLTCAAEVIINGPETYVGQSAVSGTVPKFDYFTSLPPVL